MSTLEWQPFETPVRLPADVLKALGEQTGLSWPDVRMEDIITDAIRAYMKPAPATAQPPALPAEAGYQWKEVFLPQGTRLRACFQRQPYFAVVQGAAIQYRDQTISPSGFANLHGSGNRNAWKAVWLRFPGSDEWLLADVCRTARLAAIARLIGAEAPGQRPPSEAVASGHAEQRRGSARRLPEAPPAGARNTGARPVSALDTPHGLAGPRTVPAVGSAASAGPPNSLQACHKTG